MHAGASVRRVDTATFSTLSPSASFMASNRSLFSSAAASASFFSSSDSRPKSPAGHVLERPGGQRASGRRHRRHGVVRHGTHAELVHVLRAQQHIVAAAQHRGDDGHLGQALHRFARRVVDGLLPLRSMRRGVLGQRDHLLLLGRIEQQQVGQACPCSCRSWCRCRTSARGRSS